MDENVFHANAELLATHSFIYKGKKFPFNMPLFNCFSHYFNTHHHKIEEGTNIDLVDDSDEDFNLTESTINDFINFCQKTNIILNKDNVTSLHKLANKYMVPSLIKFTENFISDSRNKLIIQFILMNLNRQDITLEKYEEMISENFLNYIEDDQLLLLPIPILHRIVTKYVLKNSLTNSNDRNRNVQPPEFINFLLKCVDRRGREASVLFDQVDFGSIRREVVDQLLKENSDKFDFHFINCNYMKTVYELESELIEREERMKNELSQMKLEQKRILDENKRVATDDFNQMRSQREERDRAIEQRIQQKMEELDAERERMAAQQNEFTRQLQESLREKDDQIRQKHEEIERIIGEYANSMRDKEAEIAQMNADFQSQCDFFRQKIEQLNGQIEDIRYRRVKCHFSSESDPSGIISLLNDGVTLTAGGENHPNYPLSNIRRYDDNRFYNCCNSTPSSESASYIKFDFGPSKKIDLYSYFIRSNSNPPSFHYHPKTWRIEGSNDDVNWTPLDQRVDDANLNGHFYQHNFPISTNNHGSESMRYRYIRYVQQDSWCSGCPYRVYISYFELFGDIYG